MITYEDVVEKLIPTSKRWTREEVNNLTTRLELTGINPHEVTVDRSSPGKRILLGCSTCSQNTLIGIQHFRYNNYHCQVCTASVLASGINDVQTKSVTVAKRIKLAGIDPTQLIWRGNIIYDVMCITCCEITKVAGSVLKKNPNSCAVCAGMIVIVGKNDVATTHPILAERLVLAGEDPTKLTAGSPRKVNFKCLICNEINLTSMASLKSNPMKCPVCTGRKLVPGVNDMATKNTYIAARMIAAGEDPTLITESPKDKVKIRCFVCLQDTYAFPTDLKRRAKYCSVCAGVTLVRGWNDLATKSPEGAKRVIAAGADPSTVVAGADSVRIPAKCFICGEVTMHTPNRLTHSPGVCGKCPKKHGFTEKALVDCLILLGIRAEHSVNLPVLWGKTTRGAEVDILLPDLNTVVEYDGYYWHKYPRKFDDDKRKTIALIEAGYNVIRIREQADDKTIVLDTIDLHHENLIQLNYVSCRATRTEQMMPLAQNLNRILKNIKEQTNNG